MPKIKLLIIGYSRFAKRRLIPSLKKNKKINYYICSKSKKINHKKKIFFNDYNEALLKLSPQIVYISLVNSLHYKYAKKSLEMGLNVIVDKPITTSLKETKELLKIAKRKKILLSEATLFNYHRVFKKMISICNGKKNISHIQSNFNIPVVKNYKILNKTKGDCEMDMSPYAASIIRLFTNNKIKELRAYKEYFTNNKNVKKFYIMTKFKKSTYFGNFGLDGKYINQITFFTKNKIITSPERIFALPSNKNLYIISKEDNVTKKIKVKKDDCVQNFFQKILLSLKNKNFEIFYKNLLNDAIIREKIKVIK